MQNLNPKVMRLSQDFGNGSMDLSSIVDSHGPELWRRNSNVTAPSSSPYPTMTRNSNENPNKNNIDNDPNRRDKRRQQQLQNAGPNNNFHNNNLNTNRNNIQRDSIPTTFRKPLSRSYRQASNNPKNIGITSLNGGRNNFVTLDIGLKQHLAQFNSLPIELQHKTIIKYEENGQSCKIMNKPFHYNENDRAYRASMFSQSDMEYQRSKLVLATGKEWYELTPDIQRSIYDQVNSMGQQTRNVLIRCITIETYYRNKLQYDIYKILDKYLINIKNYNSDINNDIKNNIMQDIRDLLKEFQAKRMQYSFKYIIKLELIERKDRRLNIKNNKLDKKKMRKHKNMGCFISTSNCIWDNKNDDFIAIQWPKNPYYKPIRPIPKIKNMDENELQEIIKNLESKMSDTTVTTNNINNNNNNNNKNVSGNNDQTNNNEEDEEDNNENNDNENSETKENENKNENDDGNENKEEIKEEEIEIDHEKIEIEAKLTLRDKMRKQVSEEEAKWEDSFLKPVYCLLNIWALKTYNYFDQNMPDYSKRNNNNNGNGNKSIDMKKLNVNNKDLKDDKQKEKHTRTVSFATENKIEEGDSDEESETPIDASSGNIASNNNDDNDMRSRSRTVDIATDDEYEDA